MTAPETVAPPVCRELLVKLAMRCDLACTYCYWFRDDSVLAKPPLLRQDVADALPYRLERHFAAHGLDRFTLLFHGGEPLLYGKARFAALAAALRAVEQRTRTALTLSITTNAMLLDEEWAALFRRFDVRVSLSIDGPAAIHDRRRVDHKGRPTHARVVAGIGVLRSLGLEPGVLAVCDPATDPADVLRHLVDDLGFASLDVLVPDHTHDDAPASVAAYYKGLFDAWFDTYASRGVRIRYLDAIIAGLLGGTSRSQVIGGGPITSVTLLTDGSLEALDTLRTAGTASTSGTSNILRDDLQSIAADPLWREILRASTVLPDVCRSCEHVAVCGGGHIASRWSAARRYDNQSVYCADIQAIIAHMWNRIRPTLYYEAPGPLAEVATP